MALVVQTNMSAITAQKHINANTLQMNKAMERLSSGFRINAAADDAAGYAISTKLASQGARLKVAAQNAAQASAMVKMADAAINEIQNMIVRIQALATQGASAQNSSELASLKAEAAKLETQINKIAAGTEFNGIKLLDGTGSSTTVFQVGATNATSDQITIDLSKAFDATSLGLTGATTAFATQTGAQGYITTATSALNTLISQRADLGAVQNQLEYVNASLATTIEQISSSVSTIRDADMAEEMANFTKSQILVQAGTAMLAQANQVQQNVLQLFR